ncbi:glycosyltransferase family 9 protein [Paracraurococcus lichenis]|uniref:Glycosyltransferase family 9 protein n=1 Tax=Paracraurococcus lichenis TaxID=3064888 RepID=A0ABT9DWC6_9PROT|nr:glycosyltransferase family 9 protein [Paracraurococcus sp. LOR1-02]MDO9708205.1 glycosyltransferase family 9 protein [Paracraurococcus sp. LOR1-02]
MRILFISSTRIGDAVLSTGLLDHLIRTYPHAKIAVACGPVAEGVFARMPNRAWTIVLAKRRFRAHWWELWREVAGQRWDIVVDLRGSAFAWLVRARKRYVIRGGRQPGHRLAHLGALLGLDPPPLPVAWFNQADRARAAKLLPGEGMWIALGPTANWDRKVWPAERFVALFRALTAPGAPLEGACAAILGGPGPQERAMAAPVLEALGDRAVDLVGALALPEVAAVLARCALFVGNDSGLMHLSAATGTPTLGLFGPSRVEEYAPAGRRTATAVAPGSPALDSMPGLTLESALAAAERLLAAKVAA